jgi:KDO2-lipid IV(A) lauroyltransferase
MLRLLLKFFVRGLCLLPLRSALWIGDRSGDLFLVFCPSKRKIVVNNLSKCALPLPPGECQRTFSRSVFRHFGRVGIEFARLAVLSDDQVREIFEDGCSGLEHVVDQLEKGKGVIIFSGHIGNWELVMRRIRIEFPVPVNTLIRPIKSPTIHHFVLDHRARFGGGPSILSDKGAKPILRALGRGEIVNIVIDQCAGKNDGAFVPFFDRPALTHTSLARLSYTLGIPVIPALSFRREDGIHHSVLFSPPIEPFLNLSKEESVLKQTALCTAFLESAIRDHPEQWIWMHRRWKTRGLDLPGWSSSES